ncbi:glycosyltransferase family 2 protein [Knoellia sp. LjRoot47]|uniref:glycosyltransferase family 2 protein n=1 Tax=Knoellia sp. LjRoot47 TaxID=3342330 RepID=UPI003ED0A449
MTHVHAPGHGPSPLPATVARVFAIIPAHDEAAILPGVLGAVRRQVQSDRILVVADNCTDDTADIARANGVGVHVTVDNAARKAGALNQGLSVLLPTLDDDDVLLVMDADTEIARGFVDAAVRALAEDPERGAVGGIFTGTDPRGFLEQAQANEYARYAREVERTRRVQVLSGTASVIRVRALREVGRARGTLLPGTPGEVYDATALTEDMELTLALSSLGWSLSSPAACRTSTQLMPTVRALQDQRLRWYRGAIDNLRTYGWTPVTRRYVRQQVMLAIGALAMALYLTVMIADAVLGRIGFQPFWAGVGVLFALERVVTAWHAGWRGRVLAVLLVPELFYDVLLQIAFVRAVLASLRRTEGEWRHDTAPPRRRVPA